MLAFYHLRALNKMTKTPGGNNVDGEGREASRFAGASSRRPSGARKTIRRDPEKRREQNRQAQKAYSESLGLIFEDDALLAGVQSLTECLLTF